MTIQQINKVEQTLNALHLDAKKDIFRVGKGIAKSIFRPIQPIDFENVYMPISKQQGQDIRQLIIENNCQQIVEFGTSFGISTIYLADAAQQTGGKVVTTELLESKAQKALKNIEAAGLQAYVDVRIGDAMKTLKEEVTPIDFLFLDGWKNLYLPLFQMLAPRFHESTLIYADNMDMAGTAPYADYILKNNMKYASKFVHQGKGVLTQVIT
ncbi:MAG: class I SAM-dependent methyltransferase [Bacteroidota bacterium]